MLNRNKAGLGVTLGLISRHFPGRAAWGLLVLACSLSGCDFLKIKEEAVTTQNTAPAKPPEAPAAAPAPPPPPPPPKETPEQIAEKVLAGFKSKIVSSRADGDVQALANLHEGARASITELNLETSQVTGASTKVLKSFPNLKILNLSLVKTLDPASSQAILDCKKLESLYLDEVQIDDNFIKGLGALDGIKDLQISRTNVTERAVGNLLKQLPNLERLSLVGLQITGQCFQSMTSKKMRQLYIDYTPIVPAGMKYVGRMPLTDLSAISCRNMGDAGVAALAGMKELKTLNIGDNQQSITNQSMVAVGKIKTLEILRIANNSQINDLGLSRLRGLKNLRKLVANGTACTPQGMAALQKLIPDLNKEGM